MRGTIDDAVRRPPTPAHAAPRRVDTDLLVVGVLAVVGAVVGLADDAAPTGFGAADGLWRAAAGALVVICGAWAPPVAWVVAGGAAAASSSEPMLVAIGVVSLAVATVGAIRFDHLQAVGAAVGLGVITIGLRLPHDSRLGLATIVAVAIAAPLVLAAWYWGPPLLARTLNALTGALTLALLATGVALLFAAFDARSDLREATDLVDEAVTSFRDGDEQAAEATLLSAVDALDRADRAVTRPWLGPGRWLPVIGQHTEALQVVSARGLQTGRAALDVLEALDRDSLTIAAGAVDLDAVRVLEPSVRALAVAAERATADLSALDSPWLVAPVAAALEDAIDELDDVTVSARRASDAITLAPTMLGGEGIRRHLVLLVTPAELRGSGGLIGNWALIEADQGALQLAGVGRAEDLNAALADAGIRLVEPSSYVDSYGGFSVETEFQDITLSPHFPDVGAVAAQLFEAATGQRVDTVMAVDPAGVAALLQLTGPVTVDGRTVDASNAREFLLLTQYTDFEDESERVAFLERLLTLTFSRLLAIEFPDPWDLDEVFAGVVDEDRLVIASTKPDEQVLLDDLGVAGGFPARENDFVAVLTQNAGQNKIDSFLARTISYDAALDPDRGTVTATVTVELTNLITNLDLPDAIVAHNDQDHPRGTNVLELTVYSPHRLVTATVDGVETGFGAGRQFGVRAYSRLLEIPPDTTMTVQLEVVGVLDLSSSYDLTVPVQPAVAPDRFEISVTVPDGVTIDGITGPWVTRVTSAADLDLTAPLRRVH